MVHEAYPSGRPRSSPCVEFTTNAESVFQGTYDARVVLLRAVACSGRRRRLLLLGPSMWLACEAMLTSLYVVPGLPRAVQWQRGRN